MEFTATLEECLRTDIKAGLVKELFQQNRITQPQFSCLMEALRSERASKPPFPFALPPNPPKKG